MTFGQGIRIESGETRSGSVRTRTMPVYLFRYSSITLSSENVPGGSGSVTITPSSFPWVMESGSSSTFSYTGANTSTVDDDTVIVAYGMLNREVGRSPTITVTATTTTTSTTTSTSTTTTTTIPGNIRTETVATEPPDRARKIIGVGEPVKLTLETSYVGPVVWVLSGDGSLSAESGNPIYFTASDRASRPIITEAYEGGAASVTFDVIEPTSVLFENDEILGGAAPPAQYWIGIEYAACVYVQPDTVSFKYISLWEGSASPVKTGYYENQAERDHQANGPHGIEGWASGKGNKMAGDDYMIGSAGPGPFADGTCSYALDWPSALDLGRRRKYRLSIN